MSNGCAIAKRRPLIVFEADADADPPNYAAT
jgi:hypothetical protein